MELINMLKDIVIEKTSVAVSNYFADNAMLAYEDDEPIETLDKRAISAYEGCKQEVCSFLTFILAADMLANELPYAECTVHMPDGDMPVSIGAESPSDSVGKAQEVVKTKLGIFDEFTWQMLCDIKKEQNPLKICFTHIEEYLRFLLHKLDWREIDLCAEVITKALLEEHHIQEPVPIHELINLHLGVGKFCNDGKETMRYDA